MKLLTKLAALILAAAITLSACAGEKKPLGGNIVDVPVDQFPGDIFAEIVIADYGSVRFKLFPDIAPKSVERFCALAERGYYDLRSIHRVLGGSFMQGGSLNYDGTDGRVEAGEKLDSEVSDEARNFYGALVLAPDDDGKAYCQFYVVNSKSPANIAGDIAIMEDMIADTKRPINTAAKTELTAKINRYKKFSDDVKQAYSARGGLYRMDGLSSVIGQAIDGFDVIDAIAEAETAAGNAADDAAGKPSRPISPIIITTVKITRIPYPEPTVATEATETEKTKKTKKTTGPVGLTTPPASASESVAPSDGMADSVLSDSNRVPDVTTAPESAAATTVPASDSSPASVPETAPSSSATSPPTESAAPASSAADGTVSPDIAEQTSPPPSDGA